MSRNLKIGSRGLLIAATAMLGPGCDRANKTAATPGDPGRAKAADAIVQAEDAPPVETDPAKLLFRALVYRDAAKVDKILREHPELVKKPINDVPPLWMACESRSLPLVKSLVERGADLKGRNAKDQTVLWVAVGADSVPVVKYLIEKGADPKALQEDKETLLWAVNSKEMAQFLVEAGVDPKHKSALKDTALHQACRNSRKDVIEVLLNLGLDIEQKGNWDMPPLHSAVTSAVGEPQSVVLYLLDRGAKIDSRGFQGHTALHECAFYGRLEMADLLLGHRADVGLKDDQGKTPMDLAMAARAAVPQDNQAIRRLKLINMLVRHGAEGKLIPLPTLE